MTEAIGATDVERFRAAVARHLGLSFEEGKLPFLADRLRDRLHATGSACEAYLTRLDVAATGDEVATLARELTVSETYFFRNRDQFRAFAEWALPERLRARQAQKRLRLLSAGCASGEEPYSLGIIVHEAGLDSSWDVSIRAVDLNPAMIERARRGRYSAWALRETPAEAQERWFCKEGKELVLTAEARAAVQVEERNLIHDDSDLWQAGSYDVVFCRNVIMYFTPETAQKVVERIARSLVPGGFLFLGHAETLRGLSNSFHLRHTHDTFYYQRKDPQDSSAQDDAPAGSTSRIPVARFAAVVDSADGWVDAIQRASERITALAATPRPASRPALGSESAPRPRWEIGRALELLRSERFADALDVVQALPPASAGDLEVRLLRAVLLTHGGRFAQAEEACQTLLQLDELNAGAHYLLALCREGDGDRLGAVEHDQVATYLDPAFAMPRLHLGLLARRRGDREAARRELGQALLLLQREEAGRLLLFGGGFGRDALLALCRAEISTCGGRP
jgi:chemotaxis protein methyltransferase CheR